MKFLKKSLQSLFALLLVLSLANSASAEIIIDMPSQVNQGWPLVLNYKNTSENASIEDDVRVIWRDKDIKLALSEETRELPQSWFQRTFTKPEPEFETIAVHGSILLAMPLNQRGKRTIEIHINNEVIKKEVEIIAVNWPKSTISVEPKYVAPPAKYNDLIKRARANNAKAYATISDFNSIQLPLVRPAAGTISSPFGVQRVYNGQLNSIHYGTDFRGPIDSDLLAIADGVVLIAEEQYYSGNTVVIDHGQNVLSIYMHLNSFNTKAGDTVKAGDKVGGLGATGRVTGPHLHLALRLNGSYVDVMPLFEEEIDFTGPITVSVPRPVE